MSSCGEDYHRRIRHDFPYFVQKFSTVTIVLDDHIKLAGTLWIPRKKTDQSIAEEKFATILEYLPYRKADWTSNRDEMRLKYFSGFGYVSLRVDRRGTGNSEGLFDDEYSLQEQSDGLQILQWIEKNKTIIYGKSWGGFNGLQIAFHQPKNLIAVISAYSTDDRYSDDIHYTGGSLTAQEALNWSSQMLIWLSIPPHQKYQGGIDENSDLMKIWKERLEAMIPLDSYWLQHQNRDSYWRYRSVSEDYSRILCPVFLIAGFADLYTDSVFRLMSELKCSKRAVIGPWGHQWPDDAYPAPQIGYLEEIIQWLDYHVKGLKNGYEKKEMISIYQLHPYIGELHSNVKERKGKWIHFNTLPKFPNEHRERNSDQICSNEKRSDEKEVKYYLSYQSLDTEFVLNGKYPKEISFLSPEETGIASGNLLGWGNINDGGNAIDQREDDGRSLTFDSLPIKEDLELFGFPMVILNLSSNSGYGFICVRLCIIDEQTGASILLSRGFLNLAHWKSHQYPQPLQINEISNIEIRLSSLCVKIVSGSRLRLSLSTSYWPVVWPSLYRSTLRIHLNERNPSVLSLPSINENYSSRDDFPFPEVAQGIQLKILRNPSLNRFRIFDEMNERITLQINTDDGSLQYADGLIFDESCRSEYQITKNNPQSAQISIKRFLKYSYEDSSAIDIQIQTESMIFTKEILLLLK